MTSNYNLFYAFIPLLIGFLIVFKDCEGAGPPKWEKHNRRAMAIEQRKIKIRSIDENPNAKYNPNLPEDLRAKYKGQKWNEEAKNDVCLKTPDSGYFCMGAVGDLPPIHQRFYFDAYTQTCQCMLYNGCDGNQNNFRSFEHCLQWCSPNITLFDRRTINKPIILFAKNSAKCLYFY